MEFKSFPDIKKLGSTEFSITQKIHGTNAQIMIVPVESNRAINVLGNLDVLELDEEFPIDPSVIEVSGKFYRLYVGSRTRWIVPGDDNYGFAAFVYANKEEFIAKLGPGQHFGEWAGPGINSGEGLTQKTLVLFDYYRYDVNNLPPQTVLVPCLFQGLFDLSQVETTMAELKANGSKLQPGFMHPEGVVVQIKGTRYKVVFDAEETQWKKTKALRPERVKGPDFSHLLQPIRLEKLLSKDERYTLNYPTSLKDIAFAYMDDLVKEEQIKGTEQEINGIKKQASSMIFAFVKETFKEKGL